ncbi:MAG: hypothetical protein ACK5L7_06310, partial [Paludibacteraceae bacterium]
VFTAEGTEVHGRALHDAVTGTNVDAQLWRFEDAGNGWFHIINKVDGKKIDVAYDASRSIGYAATTTTPASKFKLAVNSNTGFYTIESELPAVGGGSSEIYLHQANDGGGRDYIIMLVGTDYGFGSNSALTFVPYVDYNIEYSDDSNEIWYNIVNGKLGTDNLSIRDNDGQGDYPLSVDILEAKSAAQQWKVIKDTAPGEVYLVNRGTGNYIHTQSVSQGIFNLTQLGATAAGTQTLNYIGQGQYTISGVEQDDTMRYLHLSSINETPQEYTFKNALNSPFAWYFRKADDDMLNTSIPTTAPVKIIVRERRVIVETDNYTLRDISGNTLRKNTVLPAGIYLVTTKGTTTKVIVK